MTEPTEWAVKEAVRVLPHYETLQRHEVVIAVALALDAARRQGEGDMLGKILPGIKDESLANRIRGLAYKGPT